MRGIARLQGVAPSSVLRRIRFCEDLTDDPAYGPALEHLAREVHRQGALIDTLALYAALIAPQQSQPRSRTRRGPLPGPDPNRNRAS